MDDALTELKRLRGSIDNMDSALIHLLAERFKITQQVGRLKAAAGLPPADPDREAAQIRRLRALAEEAHLDPELAEKPRDIIRERRCNAEWALVQQMEHLVEQFEQFDDPYLRERKFDVVQVVERVVKELLGHPGRAALKNARKSKEESLIVVAHDEPLFAVVTV